MATVCANLLAEKGCDVSMWGPFPEHIREMTETGRNARYLPGVDLHPSLRLTADPARAVDNTQLIVASIPTQYIRSVWQRFADHLPEPTAVLSVAKGIENDTLMLPTQIIADVLSSRSASTAMTALSGPTIARELAARLPASASIAGEDAKLIAQLQELFTTDFFRIYTNHDLMGVELAGAVKNVIALAAGIVDGLGLGYNAKSSLLSRGLAEIVRLGTTLGAETETFFGMTGVGDLATTCFCPTSRNRTAGEMLGKGMVLEEVPEHINGVVEGVATTKSVMQLARKHGVEMPIVETVHAVLFEGLSPQDAIGQLMSRAPKAEQVGH